MERPEIFASVKDVVEKYPTAVTLDELEATCGDDEELSELLHELTESCIRYTGSVAATMLEEIGSENRAEADANQSRIHNSMMDSMNILARNIRNKGKKADWIDTLPTRTHKAKLALQLAFAVLQQEIEGGIDGQTK